MSIQRPREEDPLPMWHPSAVLQGFLWPPFAENGSGRNVSLEFLTYKMAFLLVLASGAQCNEFVALSWADHNLSSQLRSRAKFVSVKMVPKFLHRNVTPEVFLKPIKIPGIAHLFPGESNRLPCPVRALSLYKTKTQHLADRKNSSKRFVHFKPDIQVLITIFVSR